MYVRVLRPTLVPGQSTRILAVPVKFADEEVE